MTIQLKSTRSKNPRIYMHLIDHVKLIQLANNMGSGMGKQRQKAQNELVRRGFDAW